MTKTLEVKTTARFNENIVVNISDEICLKFGFAHKDLVVTPHQVEATIIGVAPSNEGDDVLWYEIDSPKTKGKVCYWGGDRNLLEAGFKKKFA